MTYMNIVRYFFFFFFPYCFCDILWYNHRSYVWFYLLLRDFLWKKVKTIPKYHSRFQCSSMCLGEIDICVWIKYLFIPPPPLAWKNKPKFLGCFRMILGFRMRNKFIEDVCLQIRVFKPTLNRILRMMYPKAKKCGSVWFLLKG